MYTWKDMCVAVKETKEEPSKLIINILNDIIKKLPEYYNMQNINI